MTSRLRVATVHVHPILVWDDGETLTPGPETRAVQVPLKELSGLADQITAQLEALAEQAALTESDEGGEP